MKIFIFAFVLTVLFHLTIFSQGNSLDTSYSELKKQNLNIYKLISRLRTDKNALTIDSLVAEILKRRWADDILFFCNRTDTAVFTDFKQFTNIDDSVLKFRYETIGYCSLLVKLCGSNIDTILLNIEKIDTLSKRLNQDSSSLKIVNNMSKAQRVYIFGYLNKAIIFCDDYFEVANEYNPLLPVEQRRKRLEELKLKYKKPLQQAYIRQQQAKITGVTVKDKYKQ